MSEEMDAIIKKQLEPNREQFGSDPFGYSALAWHKWAFAQNIEGYYVDLEKPPTIEDLNSPLLWLSHAHAMTEAARIIFKNEPNLSNIPKLITGVCDSQYCAIGLMLVGYSLEICLKAILVIKKGVASYTADSNKHHHHNLESLAIYIPSLSKKEKAILLLLSHYSSWAGRYPSPKPKQAQNSEEIFNISEKHKISAKELFQFATKITKHVQAIID